MNDKSKDGVCDPCNVLLNNLIVSQYKEEPAHSPDLKQVLEEEEEEEKVLYRYDDDNVDFDKDSLPAEDETGEDLQNDYYSDDSNEKLDDPKSDEDPSYDPEDKALLTKPTIISIRKRKRSAENPPVQKKRRQADKTEAFEYQCPQCEYKTARQDHLMKHCSIVHSSKKFKCEECEFTANTKQKIDYHVQTKHRGVRFYCDQCDHSSSNKSNLNEHIRRVHRGIRYPCKQCSLDFADSKRLKHHVNLAHGDGENLPTCPHCGKTFTTKSSLGYHIQNKHEGFKYSCDKCSFQTASIRYIRIHNKTVHEGALPHQCDRCDFKTAHWNTLDAHIKSKHEGVRFFCDQCGYQASTKGNLKKHINIMHSGVKLQCDQCNYQTAQQRVLDTHIKFVHEGIGYTCDYCGHKTSTESNLKQHIRRKHLQ